MLADSFRIDRTSCQVSLWLPPLELNKAPNERVDRAAALPKRIDKKAAAAPVERAVRRKMPRIAITLRMKPTNRNTADIGRNQAHQQAAPLISQLPAEPYEPNHLAHRHT